MKKHFHFLLMAVLSVTAIFAACKQTPPEEEPSIDPADLKDLKLSVPTVQDWLFTENPAWAIHVENPNPVSVDAAVIVTIKTDTKKAVATITKDLKVPAGKSDIDITMPEGIILEPGFYKANCIVNRMTVRSFVFGVSPSQLVSAPDKQADFDTFWDAGVAQLEAIPMNAQLTELSTSTAARKAYLVEMQSVPDGLTGDPVIIRGYYLEPADGKKHPVIMHFQPYDDQKPTYRVTCPSGGNNGTYAEFYLSHRGQYINNRPASLRVPDDGKGDLVNSYGD